MTDTVRGGTERVEFFVGDDKLWHFRRVAGNNEIVATSEGYQNHADALHTAYGLFDDVPWFERSGKTWSEIGYAE
jgi:hypothetical protein